MDPSLLRNYNNRTGLATSPLAHSCPTEGISRDARGVKLVGRTCRNTIIQRIAEPSRASWRRSPSRWRGFDQPAVNKGEGRGRGSVKYVSNIGPPLQRQYSSRFAIQFHAGNGFRRSILRTRGGWMRCVSRCNSTATETNLLILFPATEKI